MTTLLWLKRSTARFEKKAVFVLLLIYTSLLLLVIYSTTTNTWNRFLFNATSLRRLPPQTNVVFIKTHKCASETLSAIFRRYGYERRLSFVLPLNRRNNLGWPETLDQGMFRPSKTGGYNILCEHTVLTLPLMTDIMPNDTMFVTTIREPFEHMKSAFCYWNLKRVCAVNSSDAISEYMRHLHTYDEVFKAAGNKRRIGCIPSHISMTKNSMAFDLGFPNGFAKGTKDMTKNVSAVQEWLNILDKRLDFVVIVEYFDLSVVMLRRVLRWNTKDIIYVRRNTQSHKVTPPTDEQLVRNYKVWSHIDYLLYNHFNKTLWQKVSQQSDDFWDEYRDFDNVLNKTREFCNAKEHRQNETLQFPEHPWSDSFNVTVSDCETFRSRLMAEIKRQYNEINVRVQYKKPTGSNC